MLNIGLTIQTARELVKTDFDAVNELISKRLSSNIPLIQEIAKHIITSGGKRLRPLLVLLSAKTLAYQGQAHVELAAIVEFLHTATLLHDDVVDASTLRRGKKTVNALWGNEPSILVGDFLYSRAFQMLANLSHPRAIEVIADGTNMIVEGEMLQLVHRNNPQTTEAHYKEVIHLKTAKLFEIACQLGAIIANANEEFEFAMANYGLHFGMAYQIIDDVLDFAADPQQLGKNLGDDLAEGKPTLPLIYAMQQGNPQQAALIRESIEQGGLQHLETIMQAIAATKALDYSRHVAKQEMELAVAALDVFPASAYREALIDLAQFAIQRHN